MPIFHKGDKDKEDKEKKKKKGHLTESGRWVAPNDQEEGRQSEQSDKPDPKAENNNNNNGLDETISQIDIDIPGMVVLKSKEDRHLGRLDQDMKAKETFEKQSSQMQPEIEAGQGQLDPEQIKAGNILTQKLIEKQKITPEQAADLKSFSKQMGMVMVESIVESEVMSEFEIGGFIAAECRVPFSKLDELRVHPKAKDVLPPGKIMKFMVIPLSKIGGTLNIAAVNPINNKVIKALKKKSGFEVKCIICSPTTLRNTFNKYYG